MSSAENIPETRAPHKRRPPLAKNRGGRTITMSKAGTDLVAAAILGEQGGLPPTLPRAFVEDMAQWALVWLHSEYGHMGDRSALNFQEDLCEWWPRAWMLWVFQNIGYIKYTDPI